MIPTLPRSEFAGDLSGYCSGSGPELLLIHGVGLRAEAWSPMLPALERHFTVYALDMPGHGGSGVIQSRNLASYTARFSAFFASRSAPVCVAGHSMGALIAIDLACHHASSVRAVAALNAVYQRPVTAAKAVQARAAALTQTGPQDPTATLERWFGSSTNDAATACRDWLTHCDPTGYTDAYHVFAHDPGPDAGALRTLSCPAMFVTGAQDTNSTPAMSRAMADLCPNGQAFIVNNAAHMAPMTHADMVALELIRFFNPTRGQHDTH